MTEKILHVVPSFGMGGMERVICAFIRDTYNFYSHSIVSLDFKKDAYSWISDNEIYIDFICKDTKRIKYFSKLYTYLKEKKPDLLMTYNWGATDAIWIGRSLGLNRIIHNIHGFNIDEYKCINYKRYFVRLMLYNMLNRIIVPSYSLENDVVKKYYVNRDKIAFIPNGVQTEIYKPNRIDGERKRKDLGLSPNDFVVGFLGRLDPIKNISLLLDVFFNCCRKYKNFKLLIIGDGQERTKIEDYCNIKNLGDNILLIGEKSDVIPYIRTFDVLLMTSYSEQMPMSIIECMSIGVPVVSSDVGEISNIIDHGKNGFLFDLNDEIEKISSFLFELNGPLNRQSMSRHARNKVVSEFQESQMLLKYKDVIDKALSN